ncbi:MAG: hypothetical protein KDN22_27965 [Verrucomicrobiae bacterium]|nr:hypothetical protein [Verrucomicrobiae bacterium]
MNTEFPIHRRPNESCLEPHRSEIAAMRRSQWPYRRIAEWLLTEAGLEISHEAIRKFCIVRAIEITRRKDSAPQEEALTGAQSPASGTSPVFSYDSSQPVKTKNNA